MESKLISIIIPTFNRCPYTIKEYYLNPLTWCLLSIINGNQKYLDKIIIVDDNSSDYTEEVVNKIKNQSPQVEIEYIRLKEKYNVGIVRNIGLRYVTSEYVFFMDDDCILLKDTLSKAVKLYNYLEQRENIGALHFPVFLRNNFFDGEISEQLIGKIYPEKGEIYTNFRMNPIEKLEKIQVDDSIFLKKPIKIDFFHEVFMIKTKKIKKVYGFYENINLNVILSEGLFLTQKLKKYCFQHFQVTDSQLAVIHFRFGSNMDVNYKKMYSKIYLVEGINLSLREMVEYSNIERYNTGGRGNIETIIKESISSRYALFLHLNKRGAYLWKEKTYQALINNIDEKNMLKFPRYDINKEEKIALWESALKQGKEIYEQRLF